MKPKKYKKIKKDYQKKKLSNPFFRKKAKPEKKQKNYKLSIIMIVLVVFVLTWFFLCCKIWTIKNINVQGLTRFSETEIQSMINESFKDNNFLFFKSSNIFLFNKKRQSSDIASKYNFAKVKINKKLNNTLKVEISEKPYSFIYQEDDKLYYISEDYYLIDEIINENEEEKGEREKYFILKNEGTDSLVTSNNKLKIDEAYIQFNKTLSRELESFTDDIKPDYYIVPDSYFKTLILKTVDGPQIKFNVNSDVREQLDQVLLVKNEKIKDNFNNLEYIDVRFGNKIYFYPEELINN